MSEGKKVDVNAEQSHICPHDEFLEINRLNHHCHPIDWVNATVPMAQRDDLDYPGKVNSKGGGW